MWSCWVELSRTVFWSVRDLCVLSTRSESKGPESGREALVPRRSRFEVEPVSVPKAPRALLGWANLALVKPNLDELAELAKLQKVSSRVHAISQSFKRFAECFGMSEAS